MSKPTNPTSNDAGRSILDASGEVVVELASGWTLRSGVYNQDAPDALTSGEYVRLCRPDRTEYAYWDQEEWATDPALVMGAIINSAAGLVLTRVEETNTKVPEFVWRAPSGDGWIDAWNGWYPTLEQFLDEVATGLESGQLEPGPWVLRPGENLVTQEEADRRRES
ncbi:MAG: hypothetical protein ACRDRD_12430 [Pseudonocardiaceae bacterium]